jgi:hypothetical protein
MVSVRRPLWRESCFQDSRELGALVRKQRTLIRRQHLAEEAHGEHQRWIRKAWFKIMAEFSPFALLGGIILLLIALLMYLSICVTYRNRQGITFSPISMHSTLSIRSSSRLRRSFRLPVFSLLSLFHYVCAAASSELQQLQQSVFDFCESKIYRLGKATYLHRPCDRDANLDHTGFQLFRFHDCRPQYAVRSTRASAVGDFSTNGPVNFFRLPQIYL